MAIAGRVIVLDQEQRELGGRKPGCDRILPRYVVLALPSVETSEDPFLTLSQNHSKTEFECRALTNNSWLGIQKTHGFRITERV